MLFDTVTKRKKLDARHAPYWDKIAKGRYLGYRKGSKQTTWMGRIALGGKLKYTTFDHSETWDYEKAQAEVNKWFANQINVDPEIRDMNLKAALDYYEQQMCIKKTARYAQQNAGRVRKHLPESLATTKLTKIKQAQIERFIAGMVSKSEDAEVVRKSKVSANRVLNILKAALNLAYKHKLIGSKDAWDTVEPFINVGETRKLYLTDKQVKSYLNATLGGFKNLCRACVLTGNRVGSLIGALVKDFDPVEGTLRQESKKGRGEVTVWECYLSDATIAFFNKMAKNKLPGAPLLSNDLGEHWGKNSYRRAMLEAKQKSKMPENFDLYAFRHYHISKALLAGVNVLVIAKNCGTSVRMIEKHYGKFTGRDRREMMNLINLEGENK